MVWAKGGRDPPRHRFDSPNGAYRVCYLAHEPPGCFVETFLREPDRTKGRFRILAVSELEARELSRVHLVSDLEVALLRGPGLSWRGLTASVSTTPIYSETQELSWRIHREPEAWAGIAYRSRHDNDQKALAVFDRAREGLEAEEDPVLPCLPLAIFLQDRYRFVIDFDR